MGLDKDLSSIQEVRDLVRNAAAAQKKFGKWSQQQVDKLVETIAVACINQAEPLAKMAVEETGFGLWQDKVLKNLLGSQFTWESIKDMKTVGILREDQDRKLMEIAVPMGVVAALIPSTNPTSTVMYKVLISLKAGNAIVISPHPSAKKCIEETVRIIRLAAQECGAPDGLIQSISNITIQATDTLMKHPDTGVILATGGSAMVKAAYSSGNPAIGVGPGNGPSYIERTADIPQAIRHIFESKTFDNGTICASEQSIVTEHSIEKEVTAEIEKQQGYFMNQEESEKLEKILMRPGGTMNPSIVGKSVEIIAKMAGITPPVGTRVLLSRQSAVGMNHPYSREKLCPVLAFYVEEDWEKACEKSLAILENEGAGHTMSIHSNNDAVIREFALKKTISRLLVNTPAALGGVGATTSLAPALTLGCGTVGGSITSDNITPLNLINIRRVAYGVRELAQLREDAARTIGSPAMAAPATAPIPAITPKCAPVPSISSEELERLTREVLHALLNKNGGLGNE